MLRSTVMMRRYTFKIYPNKAQADALREQARMCAVLWNALLEMREAKYRRERKTLSAYDQGHALTDLRRALPEWAAIPRGTQERVIDMLDLAFKAFFKRAKRGAGRESGYPRYKRTLAAESVPLREPTKSCWKFTAHSGPARKSESCKRGAPRARVEECNGAARAGSWRLTMRGIPGAIRARGKFPIEPSAFKTADIKYFDGAWWFSVCVDMPPRRSAGTQNLQVTFDLIDEFASVKNANGQCVPGLSPPFSAAGDGELPSSNSGLSETTYVDPANAGKAHGIEAPEGVATAYVDPANAGKAHVEHIVTQSIAYVDPANAGKAHVDSIQSVADRKFKKFSYRWRRAKRRIAHIKAREARQRREALHCWTSAVVATAAELSIVAAPIKDFTRTGRGNAAFPGAQVEIIATLNRSTLSQAPAAAIAMLEYKAREAGVACCVIKREDHQIRVGVDLRAAAITERQTRRATKREAA